jgi:hypothetical protein
MNGVKSGLLFTAAATIRVYPRVAFTHTPPLANPVLRISLPVNLNIEVLCLLR